MNFRSTIIRPAAARVQNFPALLESRHYEGLIVLFASETSGTVVADPVDPDYVGTVIDTFEIENFKPFEGEVVLGKPVAQDLSGLQVDEITPEVIDLGEVGDFSLVSHQARDDGMDSPQVHAAVGDLIEAISAATGTNVAAIDIRVHRAQG